MPPGDGAAAGAGAGAGLRPAAAPHLRLRRNVQSAFFPCSLADVQEPSPARHAEAKGLLRSECCHCLCFKIRFSCCSSLVSFPLSLTTGHPCVQQQHTFCKGWKMHVKAVKDLLLLQQRHVVL